MQSTSRPPSRSVQINTRPPADEKLGFEAAVAALGTNVLPGFYSIKTRIRLALKNAFDLFLECIQ